MTPRSGLTKSAARASRSAQAGASARQDLLGQRFQACARGRRWPAFASWAYTAGTGLRAVWCCRRPRSPRPARGVSFPCDSIERRIVCLRSAKQAQFDQPRLDLADLLFVQSAGLVFTVTGDERHRIASIEQLDDTFDLPQRELQSLRHRSQDRWRSCSCYPCRSRVAGTRHDANV